MRDLGDGMIEITFDARHTKELIGKSKEVKADLVYVPGEAALATLPLALDLTPPPGSAQPKPPLRLRQNPIVVEADETSDLVVEVDARVAFVEVEGAGAVVVGADGTPQPIFVVDASKGALQTIRLKHAAGGHEFFLVGCDKQKKPIENARVAVQVIERPKASASGR